MKIGVAAIFKNEVDYVLEWLAYHQILGVDSFYVADNISDDGTSQLLEALDHLGIVRRVYFPRVGDEGPQPPAYTHILKTYGSQVDLLAFIDADEFIVCTNSESLRKNLSDFCNNESADALALNWRCFGSSGQVFDSELPVIERFTRCSERDHPINRHIKTILKPAMAKRMLVHHGAVRAGGYYTADGKPAVFENGAACGPRTMEVLDTGLRVNHYVVKSRQEHILKKFRKGSGAGSASRKKGEDYFKAHDLNSCEDSSLAAYATDVKRKVSELKQRLANETPLWAFGTLHAVVNGARVQGWVRSEFGGPLKVRLLINEEEFLVDIDQERPDVLQNGASDKLICGFRFRYRRTLRDSDKVQVFIYGSFMQGEVRRQS